MNLAPQIIETIGRLLRFGITQRETARLVGVSRSTVARYAPAVRRLPALLPCGHRVSRIPCPICRGAAQQRQPARREPSNALASGDPCPMPDCAGRLLVSSTRVDHGARVRVRHLQCTTCNYNPRQPMIVPLEFAPARRRS